ncbi:MAG: ATP-binding cassette domain-containing protein [Firmicutes bacterium]|nr:ATP-binding cassette domain-containing protein [Bacillota bacterium]
MIFAENISFSFPQKDLFNNVSFTLENGQHCAFIGSSGSGKTTMADIIMNPDKYMFDGKLEIDPTYKIGYVSQFPNINRNDTTSVFEFLGEVFIECENEITRICAKMESGENIEKLMEDYQDALDRFDALGGSDYESNILKKLALAELTSLKDQTVASLSGGEFKLLQIMKEMLLNPDLIIMDEPDAFLDFENMNALKNLIINHKGTLLVITHNRYLLNHCFDKIMHLENKELQEFDGTYVDYNLSLLNKKIELQELSIADDLEIERNELLITRLRKIATLNSEAARGKALKARVKIQERLLARRIKAPFVRINKPKINLITDNEVADDIALKVTDHSITYDETIIDNVNFEIGSRDKVAIVGINGSGKTSMLKDIYRNDSPSIVLGENICPVYLSQLHDEILDDNSKVVEEFRDLNFEGSRAIRAYLRRFGFNKDIGSQKVSSLSGGEKNILQLAKISANSTNMLLLDEPTSHLDTYSQIALEEAIQAYNGTILMVSHDYYTIVNSMDYVLLIENKTIRKMTIKKFKRMIYKKHFDRDYLEFEAKKKSIETRIELALNNRDFESAKKVIDSLEELIKEFN